MEKTNQNLLDPASLPPSPGNEESAILDLLKRNDRKLESLVQLKLSIISPVIYHTHSEDSDKQYFKKVAEKQYYLSDGTTVTYGVSTMEKWVANYKIIGIAALIPKERSDNGQSRKLTLPVQNEIIKMVTKCPDIKCSKVKSRLEEAKLIREDEISTDTISRFIKNHDLRKRTEEDPEERIRYFFVEKEAGFLWAADTMYLCKIEVNGSLKWVYLQGIIDDHSRMIVSAHCYMEDNAINFQDTLFLAVKNYGIPVKLYVDNGAPFVDRDLKRICALLGISLIHTRSRDGASKGVIERFWLSSYYEVNTDIVLDDITSLDKIQETVDKWVDKYNHRVNRGVNGIPRERYEASEKRHPMRYPDSEETLKSAFLHTHVRTVRCGAVQQSNGFYELPDELRVNGTPNKIQIFYNPRDVENSIFTLDKNGKKYHLHKLDKEANAGKKRKTGGRMEEVREKAAEKAARQMTKSEEHAEKRYQKEQKAINRAAKATNTKEKASDTVPTEAENPREFIELDYTAV